MKSLGIVFPEARKTVVQEFDLPDPGRGEVLLDAHYSTLSPGTERNILLGVSRPLPVNIGYSMAARVVGVGEGVTRLKVGDAVVTTGRHASLSLQDERFCTPVPEGVDLEQAAFFNLAHTAMYGVRQARIELGEPVAVLGQGLVGLLTAKIAQLAGALPVIAIDIDEDRLAFSRKLGIHVVVNGTDTDRVAKIMAGLDGGGAAAVIEVTGQRQPVETALDIVRERGRIVLLSSTHGDDTVQFHRKLSHKGASIIGAYINSKPWSLEQTNVGMPSWPPTLNAGSRRYVGPGMWTSDEDIRVIMNLIKYGSLDIRPLITHRFRPEQAPEAYDMVLNQDRSLVGGVFQWK